MNEIEILISIPASGKSTYLRKKIEEESDKWDKTFVISRDDIVEELKDKYKMEYADFFKNTDEIKHILEEIKEIAIEREKVALNALLNEERVKVFIDRTNINKKAREIIYSSFKEAIESKNVNIKATVFNFSPEYLNIILDLNEKRYEETGKYIPEKVIHDFVASFEPIDGDEIFIYNEINYVSPLKNLKRNDRKYKS